MKINSKYFYLLFLFYFSMNGYGKQNNLDSLNTAYAHTTNDETKVKLLQKIAWELKSINTDTTLVLINKSLVLANKIKWKKGLAQGIYQLGELNWRVGNYKESLDNYSKSMKIWNELINSKNKKLSLSAKIGKGNTLGGIGSVYSYQNDYKKALEYFIQAKIILSESGDELGIASQIGNIGSIYYHQGDYDKAINYITKALNIYKKIGDKNGISSQLSNIGNIYFDRADYHKTLEYYFKALKISEEIGDKQDIAIFLGNIGLVYDSQENFEKAITYYLKALKIAKEISIKPYIVYVLGNIALIHKHQSNFKMAMAYNLMALKMAREIGDQSRIASNLNDIGNLYCEQKNYPTSLIYYNDALKLSHKLGDKRGVSINLGNIGLVYLNKMDFINAEINFKTALHLADSLEYFESSLDVNKHLNALYDSLKKPNLSLIHFKKYIYLQDKLNNEANKLKITRTELNYEFDKKEAVILEQQKKERAIAQEKSKIQQIIIWSVILGLLLVIVFVIWIYRTLKLTNFQKIIIEEKQKEIIDSILYAKRIQNSLLPSEKYITSCLINLKNK